MSQNPQRLSDASIVRLLDEAQIASPGIPQTIHWALLFVSGPRCGQRIVLPKRGVVRIGRGPDNWIRLNREDERDVSLHHAELVVSTETLLLKDLQSRNSTMLNNEKVDKQVAVCEGDVITICNSGTRIVVVHQK